MISSCPNMVLYHSPQKRQTIKFKLWVDWLGNGFLRDVGAQSMQESYERKKQMMHPIYPYSPAGTVLQS